MPRSRVAVVFPSKLFVVTEEALPPRYTIHAAVNYKKKGEKVSPPVVHLNDGEKHVVIDLEECSIDYIKNNIRKIIEGEDEKVNKMVDGVGLIVESKGVDMGIKPPGKMAGMSCDVLYLYTTRKYYNKFNDKIDLEYDEVILEG